MSPPTSVGAILRPVPMHGMHDCAVASLASLLGIEYARVRQAAVAVAGRGVRTGLTVGQIVDTAARLGVTLTAKPRPTDVDDATGLLTVALDGVPDHCVVVFRGVVYDPASGQLYEPDTFLATYPAARRARWGCLLEVLWPPPVADAGRS